MIHPIPKAKRPTTQMGKILFYLLYVQFKKSGVQNSVWSSSKKVNLNLGNLFNPNVSWQIRKINGDCS